VIQYKETRLFTSAVKISFPQLSYTQQNLRDGEIKIFRNERKKISKRDTVRRSLPL